MLKTPHVWLDTEVFVGKNFRYGHPDLAALVGHAQAGTIKLYLAEVTHREILKKIADRIGDAKHVLDPVRSIKARPNGIILQNVKHLGFGGIFAFDEKAIRKDLIAQFEQFLKDGDVEVVATGNLLAGPVLEKYFSTDPPFEKREEKKSEFPDAFAVATIAGWCQTNATTAYAISEDRGFREACAREKGVIPLAAIRDLTDLIARALPKQTELALGWFRVSESYLREQIARQFEALGFILSDQDGDVVGTSVDGSEIVLSEPEFLDVDEGYASIVLHAEVPFEAELVYDDPDATFWVEGDKYVVDSVETTVERQEEVDVHVELSFNPALEVPLPKPEGEELASGEAVESVNLDVSDISITVDEWDDYK
jgi:hypothetical protein